LRLQRIYGNIPSRNLNNLQYVNWYEDGTLYLFKNEYKVSSSIQRIVAIFYMCAHIIIAGDAEEGLYMPEREQEQKKSGCKLKLNNLSGFFPWVSKESTEGLYLRVKRPRRSDILTGVGVYKDNETCLAQFQRSLAFLRFYLQKEGFVFCSTFKSTKAKFQGDSKNYLGIEFIEIELSSAENMEAAYGFFANNEAYPSIDLIWVLAFNINILAELGSLCLGYKNSVLLVPGVSVGGEPVVISCVGKTVAMTTLTPKDKVAIPVLFPRYCK